MSTTIRVVLLGLFLGLSFGMYAQVGRVENAYNICRSAALFHISLLYNKYKFGSRCTFNVICSPYEDKIIIRKDATGAITAINDGRLTPLVLGGIFCTSEHVEKLRGLLNLGSRDRIELFTLTREFECDWAGLTDVIAESRGKLIAFKYPTTDYTAPTLSVVIQAVHDLRTRDERGASAAYVHCKAGKGRSAVIVEAYLIAILYDIGVTVTPEEIERFLQSRRPQVKLGASQKKVIVDFQNALQKAGSFEKLYAHSL